MNNGRQLHLYTVYDNKDSGLPVIVDGTAAECAAIMGVEVQTFYEYITRSIRQRGKACMRWEIRKTKLKEITEVLG